MSRIVVAIGGNALDVQSDGLASQLQQAAQALVPLITSGNEIVLVHGNGPQVGVIHSTMLAAQQDGFGEGAPFFDCTAMNEGTIGWHFEQEIQRELERQGRQDIPVCTVITRVVVDRNDPAFQDLEKPVGAFYDEETARQLMEQTGRKYAEDSGRGWRLMVASPAPRHIVEAETIRNLAAAGAVVIGGGGAGIPVAETGPGTYEGIEGVCDKDTTSGLIAQLIDADLLIILTAVDRVSINFGQPDQLDLSLLTPDEADRYVAEGQFPPGSMQPKVEACSRFVRSRADRKAVIANLDKAVYALTGQTGTVFTNDAVSA